MTQVEGSVYPGWYRSVHTQVVYIPPYPGGVHTQVVYPPCCTGVYGPCCTGVYGPCYTGGIYQVVYTQVVCTYGWSIPNSETGRKTPEESDAGGLSLFNRGFTGVSEGYSLCFSLLFPGFLAKTRLKPKVKRLKRRPRTLGGENNGNNVKS